MGIIYVQRVIKTREEQIEIPKEEQDMEPSTQCWDSTVFGPQTSALFSLHTDAHSSDSSQPLPHCHHHHPHRQTKCLSAEPTGSGDLTNPGQEATLETPGCIALGVVGTVALPQQTPRRVRKRHYILFLELSTHFFFLEC